MADRRPDLEVAERVKAVCPDFTPERVIARTSKSRLVRGRLAGQQVVAKVVVSDAPVWHWLLRREIALYHGFATSAPPVRTPRYITADPDRSVLVVEHLDGRRLASGRHVGGSLGRDVVAALLAALDALMGWDRLHESAGHPVCRDLESDRELLQDAVPGSR